MVLTRNSNNKDVIKDVNQLTQLLTQIKQDSDRLAHKLDVIISVCRVVFAHWDKWSDKEKRKVASTVEHNEYKVHSLSKKFKSEAEYDRYSAAMFDILIQCDKLCGE